LTAALERTTLLDYDCSAENENYREKESDMTTREANQKLMGDLKTVAHDAEDLMKATADQAGEKVAELRTRLSHALESARHTAQRLEEKTVEAAKAADRAIREHPYQSLGVAFGLGVLIGVLVARR
jgi:ElaB/YqjD/DUF883 family membrane-anchored ribosome-binding protein